MRPEFVESVLYLYKATKDPHLLQIGAEVVDSIYYSTKTDCGFATVKNVDDHTIEDRMESYFLAETIKYLYLLFDQSNFIHNQGSKGTIIQSTAGECIIDSGGYVFNTEAHPIDIAAVYCCSSQKTVQDSVITHFQDNLDLYSVLELNNNNDNFLKLYRQKHSKQPLEKVSIKLDEEKLINDSIVTIKSKTEELQKETLERNLNENYDKIIVIDEVNDSKIMNTQNVEDSLNFSSTQNSHVNPSLGPTIESSLDSTDIPKVIKTEDDFFESMNQTQPIIMNVSVTSSNEDIVQETLASVNSSNAHILLQPNHSVEGWHEKSIFKELPEEVLQIINSNPFAGDKLTKDIIQVLRYISDVSNNTYNTAQSIYSDFANDEENVQSNFEYLKCPSQSFLLRLSFNGQMIVFD